MGLGGAILGAAALGAGASVYSSRQQREATEGAAAGFGGPAASPEETMSPEERRILAAQASQLETLLPLEKAQQQTIIPLETAYTQQTLPLTTEQLAQNIPQIGALERAQMGAQQELLPAQTAFRQAQLGAGQQVLAGQPLPGQMGVLGTEFGTVPEEQAYLQRTVVDPTLRQQEAIGMLPSGATAELTQQRLQQRAIASMTQRRQELMELLRLAGQTQGGVV